MAERRSTMIHATWISLLPFLSCFFVALKFGFVSASLSSRMPPVLAFIVSALLLYSVSYSVFCLLLSLVPSLRRYFVSTSLSARIHSASLSVCCVPFCLPLCLQFRALSISLSVSPDPLHLPDLGVLRAFLSFLLVGWLLDLCPPLPLHFFLSSLASLSLSGYALYQPPFQSGSTPPDLRRFLGLCRLSLSLCVPVVVSDAAVCLCVCVCVCVCGCSLAFHFCDTLSVHECPCMSALLVFCLT